MKIKVVIFSPHKLPVIKKIEDDLFEYQKIVDGYVDMLPIGKEMTALVNRDAIELGMAPNFSVGYTTIYGPALIVRDRGKVGYEGLTAAQVEEALRIEKEGRMR
jgi:hypothetical protein